MIDGDTAECEVLTFLSELVRAIKPSFCVETGSNLGWSAQAIGRALTPSVRCHLDTYEVDAAKAAKAKIRTLGLAVKVINASSLTADYSDAEPIDFLYCDSDLGVRTREMEHFKPWLSDHHVIAVHDTSPHHEEPRKGLERMERDGLIRIVYLPTPRGIALCQFK